MALGIRSTQTRCLDPCRTMADLPLRMLCCEEAQPLMRAIRASLRPLFTISETLLSFAYLMAASISVHLRRKGGTPLLTLGRLRPKQTSEQLSVCFSET